MTRTAGLAGKEPKSHRRLPHGFFGCQTNTTVETHSQTVNFSTKTYVTSVHATDLLWLQKPWPRMPRSENKIRGHPRKIRGSIPYTAKSSLFRNKIAKPLIEQLLTRIQPRSFRTERCLPLPPTRACSPCVSDQNLKTDNRKNYVYSRQN